MEKWERNADAMLAGAAKHGSDHPQVKAKLPKIVANLADRAMERAIGDGCSGDEASRAYGETRARLEAAIEAGVTTWREAQALELATVPARQEQRREPTREELKALSVRAFRAASLSDPEPTPSSMTAALPGPVMSLAMPRSAAVGHEKLKARAGALLNKPRNDIGRPSSTQTGRVGR
jgi:hypothetical protein